MDSRQIAASFRKLAVTIGAICLGAFLKFDLDPIFTWSILLVGVAFVSYAFWPLVKEVLAWQLPVWLVLIIVTLLPTAHYLTTKGELDWDRTPKNLVRQATLTGRVNIDDTQFHDVVFSGPTTLFFDGTAPFRFDGVRFSQDPSTILLIGTRNKTLHRFAALLKSSHLMHPFAAIVPHEDGWLIYLESPEDLGRIDPTLQLDWTEPPERIIRDREFTRQVIVLDGTEYINCHFVECTFRFFGLSPFRLTKNHIHGDQVLEIISRPQIELVRLMQSNVFDFLKPDVELLEVDTDRESRGLRIGSPVIQRNVE